MLNRIHINNKGADISPFIDTVNSGQITRRIYVDYTDEALLYSRSSVLISSLTEIILFIL